MIEVKNNPDLNQYHFFSSSDGSNIANISKSMFSSIVKLSLKDVNFGNNEAWVKAGYILDYLDDNYMRAENIILGFFGVRDAQEFFKHSGLSSRRIEHQCGRPAEQISDTYLIYLSGVEFADLRSANLFNVKNLKRIVIESELGNFLIGTEDKDLKYTRALLDDVCIENNPDLLQGFISELIPESKLELRFRMMEALDSLASE